MNLSANADLTSSAVTQAEVLLFSNRALEASALLEHALDVDPGDAKAVHLSAVCFAATGNYEEAIRALHSALHLRLSPAWLRDLGSTLYAAKRYQEAISAFERALALHKDPEVLVHLGHAFRKVGRVRKALRCYDEAHSLLPEQNSIQRNRAEALLALGRFKAAEELLTAVCDSDPFSYATHALLASTLVLQKRYDRGLKEARAAETISADFTARMHVFRSLWLTGHTKECLDLGRSIISTEYVDAAFHFAYLAALDHFTPDPQTARRAWEDWGLLHGRSPAFTPNHKVDRDPDRKLRIGYLIDEIYGCPDRHFIPPLVENRNRENFTSFGYLTKARRKNYPHVLTHCFDQVCDLRAKTSDEIASTIAEDHIDILVNISWTQRWAHLLVFSRRPAPIQIEIPLYPGTTGIAATDFIFSDKWICPPGCESMYSEAVYRLDASYMPWRPPPASPQPRTAPIAKNGFCTFGLFQKPLKLNDVLWTIIGEILRRVPTSVLLIHQDTLDLDDTMSETRKRYTMQLADRGVCADRLRFIGARPASRHYKVISEVDIALDSFPYNGTTTTGDCLWMGVPVITYAGRTHAARVGLSMLSRLGLPEFVAHSASSYVAKAVALAQDSEQIIRLRSELRANMQRSPVTDGRTVMAGIEQAYRVLWKDYCDGVLHSR